MNREIDSIDLVINRMVWETYIDDRKKQGRVIPIFALRSFNPDKLFDTVPAIRAARDKFLEADNEVKRVLSTDPDYAKTMERYVQATDSRDRPLIDSLQKELDVIRARVRTNNPEFAPAQARRTETLLMQNPVIAEFLLDYYQSRGEIFPPKPVITDDELFEIMVSRRVVILENRKNDIEIQRAKVQ
jgi:alkanesulfonate monooxygenase SsuD/methylene tetrahydromethanopterin reductase-like flavin-dependent oxidoreductase (luciferase family)